MSSKNDCWDVNQYDKFANDRERPFYDLLQLVVPKPNMHVLDLGCGTGRLTKHLHESLEAKATLGVDSSASMLKEANALSSHGLTFELHDIATFEPTTKYDLIFSNAALQWLPNHPELFAKIASWLVPEGQIAIQVPANFDYPTHILAKALAQESPFQSYLQTGREPAVLSLEDYSILLHRLGFKPQCARMQVYLSELDETMSVIEWVKGTLLTYYQSRLPPDLYQDFLERYTQKILAFFGEQKPFLFPFKRILLFGKK